MELVIIMWVINMVIALSSIAGIIFNLVFQNYGIAWLLMIPLVYAVLNFLAIQILDSE